MSWEQLAEMDAFGTSPFQNLCCTKVSRLIPDARFEEALIQDKAFEDGFAEKYFVADIPTIDMKVYVYLDSAEIVSPYLDIKFDRANSRSPDDLALKLIRELSNAF